MPISPRHQQERLRGPERLSPRQRLDTLQRQVQEQHPEEDAVAAANTLELEPRARRRRGIFSTVNRNRYVNERVKKYFGSGAIERIGGAVARMEQAVDGPRGLRARLDALSQTDPFPAAQEQAIDKMLTALTQQGPEGVGGPRNKNAFYLTTRGRKENARYSVNLGYADRGSLSYAEPDPRYGIRRNQAYLREIAKTASPEQRLFLQQMIATMDEFAMRIDSRKVHMHDYRNRNHNTPVREQGRRLGRLGVLIASGAAATLTGVMSIFSGNLSATPFLYSGVALYAANPNLLDGRARRGAVQAGRLLRWNRFQAYRPQGEEWASIIERIGQGSPEVKKFLRAPTGEPGLALLDALAPQESTPRAVRTQLQKMIQSGDFPGFAARIRGVRDPDAKELVRSYVQQGAARFGLEQPAV
jgi:hypothetical protein